jgi:CBS domain-containing protein
MVGEVQFGGNRKEAVMVQLGVKDIMFPRVSLYAKDKGSELVKKLMINYPALPVVNDDLEVIGIVSDYDVLDALYEKRTVHEFSAESLMSCGHAAHGVCKEPLTISANMLIDDIVNTLYKERVSILPVVDERKKLVGIITRKSIINAIAEMGVWPDVDFRIRAA